MNDIAEVETPAAAVAPPAPLLNPEEYTIATFAPLLERHAAYIAECAQPLPDASTKEGMEACVKRRRTGIDLRTDIEDARETAKSPFLKAGKLLDARARALTAEVAPLEKAADAEVKRIEAIKKAEREAAEKAEARRVALIQERIRELGGATGACAFADSKLIAEHIADLVKVPVEIGEFAEFTGQAQVAKDETLQRLRQMHAAAVAREEQVQREKAEREAEAVRLKAEREQLERDRTAQAERDRISAEKHAADERTARAKRDAEAADLKRQRDEIARQQEDLARQRREQESREAAEANRIAIEKAAAERRENEKREEAERAARERREAEERRQAEIRAARRPSDDQLIEAVRKAFRALKPTEAEVISWISTFDADDALLRRAASCAA